MTDNVAKFKTPQEFVEYYSNELKSELKKYDIQVNKLGVVGFLMNLLGWTNYDLKQYYDYLFKEAFILTAKSSENLYLHSSIYGYFPSYATPSIATGKFVFDFNLLPKLPSSYTKIQVEFSEIKFKNGEYVFYTDAIYKFIKDRGSYYCIIFNVDGQVEYISASSPVIEVPFRNVTQIEKKTEQIKVQNYNFASFYSYIIEIENGKYLSDISVEINLLNNEDVWTKFDIRPVKYFEDSFSNIVFLRNLTATKFLMEFGSGIRGAYVPNSMAKISMNLTKGLSGNINTQSFLKLDKAKSSIILYQDEYDISGTPTGDYIVPDHQPNISVKDILKINFEYSSDGTDPLNGEVLRQRIINYIQTRNNLISERDYYNVMQKYLNDFKFLFKKSTITDNIFYLYRTFRDKFQLPIYSFNHSFLKIDDSLRPSVILSPLDSDSGELEAGTYKYIVQGFDNFNRGLESFEQEITINGTTENSVELNWTPIDNAVKYIIYTDPVDEGSGLFSYKINETYETSFIHLTEFNDYRTSIVHSDDLIFYPTFLINDYEFISPFIYKYDSFMDWYKAYILYETFIVNFSDVKLRDLTYDIPIFFFNIVYNKENKETFINVKSHQSLSDYNIKLTIPTLSIYEDETILIDENTSRLTYSNTNGLMWDRTQIEIKVYLNSVLILHAYSSEFEQIFNVTDQLKLFNYSHYLEGPDITYNSIINVPVIDKEKYDEEPVYYKDKIFFFINQFAISENRMVTDEVQFRFLDCYRREQEFNKYELIQSYDFDIIFPLHLKVNIYIDQIYLKEHPETNLSDKKQEIYAQLVDELQKKYTGTDILLYNSQIIDSVHSTRPFIKSVEVTIVDNDENVISNGIETRNIFKIMEDMLSNEELTTDSIPERKYRILRYNPGFYWWDVDNIEIKIISTSV